MTKLFRPIGENNSTTHFTIFDIIYCDMVKKYGCGILSYKISDSIFPQVKELAFYKDGFLHCKFITNDPVYMIGNNYAILFWEGKEYRFGQEPFTLDEIKDLVFNEKKSKKFKKLI